MLLNLRHMSSAADAAQNPALRRACRMIHCVGIEEETVRKIQLCVIAVILAALPVPCHGQNMCPWLNAATASGVLGGPVTTAVDKTVDKAETCSFRLQNANSMDSLRISVATVADPRNVDPELVSYENRCASSVPLKAIGNEAVLCTDDTGKSRGERVVGRVRNSIFTIEIRTHSRRSKATRDLLEKKAVAVANQVAGSLF
jgi:hypothetical protein